MMSDKPFSNFAGLLDAFRYNANACRNEAHESMIKATLWDQAASNIEDALDAERKKLAAAVAANTTAKP